MTYRKQLYPVYEVWEPSLLRRGATFSIEGPNRAVMPTLGEITTSSGYRPTVLR